MPLAWRELSNKQFRDAIARFVFLPFKKAKKSTAEQSRAEGPEEAQKRLREANLAKHKKKYRSTGRNTS